MDAINTVDYRGCKIEIHIDENPISPFDEMDDGVFLVHFHRDFQVEHKLCSEELLRYLYTKEADGLIEIDAAQLLKTHWFFPVAAYIHSGVVLSLCGSEFPDQRWDVSHVGGLFVAKSEFRLRKSALKSAQSHIQYYNDYLSGNVYGYIVDDEGGGDSCWGYFGDNRDGYMLNEAKRAIDYHLDKVRKEHIGHTKRMILSKVPLEYRATA